MYFKVKWDLQGMEGGPHVEGDVIQAELKDVEQLVSEANGGLVPREENAVLIPAEPDEATAADLSGVPGGDVNLAKLKKDDLVAHAAEHHDLTLDPTLPKPDLIAAIETARVAAVETPAA